jgi:IclR family transcriptional regulator, KDG regulon repressor
MIRTSRNFIESMARGFNLLSTICVSESPPSLTELSQEMQLAKSTIQRLTYTLQSIGLIERDKTTKRFRTGYKMAFLALSVMNNMNLTIAALPHMQKAAQKTGETITLSILLQTEILYVELIRSKHILNIDLFRGTRRPTYCTSAGKVLLAFLPDPELKTILNKLKLVSYTPYTVTSKKDLLRDLKIVRKKEFCLNNEETVLGLRSVAAPVRNALGQVIAAVNTIVPTRRVSRHELSSTYAAAIVETGERISKDLGYRKPPNRD